MIRISKKLIAITFLAVTLVISVFLSGCAIEKAPPVEYNETVAQAPTTEPTAAPSPVGECQKNEECVAVLTAKGTVLNKCTLPTCLSNVCLVDTKPQCCGNHVPEALEDAKKGNSCTCPEDFGECNSTINFETEKGTFYEARYLRRTCDRNLNCIVESINELQRNNEFFNTFSDAGFTFNIYVKYKTPFDKGNSRFDVQFKLSQLDPTFVTPPIKINEVRIMDGTNVLVRSSDRMSFTNVLDTADSTLVINDYSIVYAEEIKTITLSVDYEYIPLEQKTDPVTGASYTAPGITQRKKYDVSIQAIPFLDKTLIR